MENKEMTLTYDGLVTEILNAFKESDENVQRIIKNADSKTESEVNKEFAKNNELTLLKIRNAMVYYGPLFAHLYKA